MTARHAVLMLCYNQLALTKQALASVAAQDIGPLEIFVVNNGSSDGTREWLEDYALFVDDTHLVRLTHLDLNQSPVAVSNQILRRVFSLGHEKVLSVANDVVLPPNLYRELLCWPRGMVTASQCAENPPVPMPGSDIRATSECTPMAVMLLRRWCHDALVAQAGYFFDEGYFNYASDCDLALRMAACGIRGVQLNLPYWHHGSATWRLAPEIERKGMLRQADVDRGYFQSRWGFRVDDPEYAQRAQDINFRAEVLR